MQIKLSSIVAAVILAVVSISTTAHAATTSLTNAVIKYPWNSSASAGLTLTKGNSDTVLFTIKLFTDKKTPVNEFSIGTDAAYGENASVENTESLHGFSQWNHLFSDKFFAYLRIEGLHDGIAHINYRFTFGPGAGYYIIKDKQTTLATEIGGSYVVERLGTNDISYETLRVAERFEHKFKTDDARLWQNIEILPQTDKFRNYLINAEVGIEAAIVKNVCLQVYVDDNFNSEPAAGRERNDVKLVSGVSYKF